MSKISIRFNFVSFVMILIICIASGYFFHSISLGQSSGMSIPSEPPMQDDLLNLVTGPSEIDAACDTLGIPARLMNFNLATPQDLTDFNMGHCIHIPVAITTRTGGRKSLYYLSNNEEVLAGIFVNSTGFAKRYVKRISGIAVPAEDGDEYEERWVNHDESILLYKGAGELEILDSDIGLGEVILHPDITSPIQINAGMVWVGWSCIKVEWK